MKEISKSAAISSEKKYEQIQQDIDDIRIELENERCWFDIPKIYILILNSNSIVAHHSNRFKSYNWGRNCEPD